jgi:serine/threonine protein kinase
LERFGGKKWEYSPTPEVSLKGLVNIEEPHPGQGSSVTTHSFFVMEQYGLDLQRVYEMNGSKFSPKTIYMLGIKLLDIFERVHQAGYTYNDLKLDNILIGDSYGHFQNQIRLVDFGFAAKFLDENGNHYEQVTTDVFRGNMIFATLNQFEFKTTSRKDDLQSLVYLMVYLLRNHQVKYICRGNGKLKSKSQIFNYIRQTKEEMTIDDLLGT